MQLRLQLLQLLLTPGGCIVPKTFSSGAWPQCRNVQIGHRSCGRHSLFYRSASEDHAVTVASPAHEHHFSFRLPGQTMCEGTTDSTGCSINHVDCVCAARECRQLQAI